jgi:hypothetical protein
MCRLLLGREVCDIELFKFTATDFSPIRLEKNVEPSQHIVTRSEGVQNGIGARALVMELQLKHYPPQERVSEELPEITEPKLTNRDKMRAKLRPELCSILQVKSVKRVDLLREMSGKRV